MKRMRRVMAFAWEHAQSYVRWFLSSLLNSNFLDSSRPLIIVTGADSTHFRSELQFLDSAVRNEPDATIVMWDLGLSEEEAQFVQEKHPGVHYRKFSYADYPGYFLITESKGEYAWKPTVVFESAREFAGARSNGILLWCDAGNVVFKKLRWLRRYVGKNSVFAPFSRGTLRDWTHPDTVDFFELTDEELARSNCASGFVGFDLASDTAWSVLQQWSELALRKDVFAPPGSSRLNHRQDQAVLGCILVKQKLLSDGSFRTNWTEEYLTGRDIDKSGADFMVRPEGLFSRMIHVASRRFN